MEEITFIREWLFYGDIPRIAKSCGIKVRSLRTYLGESSGYCSKRALAAALVVAKKNEKDMRKMRHLYVSGGIRGAEIKFISWLIGADFKGIYEVLRRKNKSKKIVLSLLAYFEGRMAMGMGSEGAQLLFRSGWDGEGLKARILDKIKGL